jgi:hypothetical protein
MDFEQPFRKRRGSDYLCGFTPVGRSPGRAAAVSHHRSRAGAQTLQVKESFDRSNIDAVARKPRASQGGALLSGCAPPVWRAPGRAGPRPRGECPPFCASCSGRGVKGWLDRGPGSLGPARSRAAGDRLVSAGRTGGARADCGMCACGGVWAWLWASGLAWGLVAGGAPFAAGAGGEGEHEG